MIVKSFVLRKETADRIAQECTEGSVIVVRPEKKLEALFRDVIRKALVEKRPLEDDFSHIKEYYEKLSDEPSYRAKLESTLSALSAYLSEGMFIQATLSSIEDYVLVKCARLCAEAVNVAVGGTLIDGTELMICRQQGSHTVVDWSMSRAEIARRCTSEGKIVISGGFGRLESGYVVRIGRGGAYLMTTLIASAINAKKVEFYVEENGIAGVNAMTYDEAAHYCASPKAFLPSAALWPVKAAGIPVVIRNIMDASFPGTVISFQGARDGRTVSGVILDKDLVLLTVFGTGLLGQVGLSSAVFSAMSSAGVNVRFISQSCSEYSLSFAVRSEDADSAEAEISRRVSGTGDYDDVMLLRRNIGIVTVYGDRMKNVAGTSGKVYSALGSEGISVVAAAQGGEELSISIAVDLKDADKAATILESL